MSNDTTPTASGEAISHPDSPLAKEITAEIVHDLRNRLNSIISSATLLERLDAVDRDQQKYLQWILENAHDASSILNQWRPAHQPKPR